MYKVSEQDINAAVNDFTVFCDFVETKKPVLSKARGTLGKNDLFELNSLLYYRSEVDAPNFQMESYPIINLIFNLALLGKLYIKETDEKGKIYLTRTVRKDEFDALNSYEKYTFILEIFWTKYDMEDINYIDLVVQALADSAVGEELIKGSFSQRIDLEPVFSYLSGIIRYFNYFGLCTYIPIIETNKKIDKYKDSIKAVIPTELGVNMCKVLIDQKIVDWNIPWLKERQIYNERKKSGYIPLYKFLQPVFPEGVLNKTVTSVIDKVVKGSYVFKVSLYRDVWRKIKISFNHTLENLHYAVQEAFDFDDDHLYSFFMDNKRFSKHAYHSPMSDSEPFADEVTIGELELYEGQKILYLFDYGDSWEFEVQLLKILKDEIPPVKPEIIEVKGEAPPQYEYYDDDDE